MVPGTGKLSVGISHGHQTFNICLNPAVAEWSQVYDELVQGTIEPGKEFHNNS